MKLQIQSIHFTATEELQDYVQRKCDKLDTFFDRIIDGQVYLKLGSDKEQENKIVEIKLNVPGDEIVASHKGVKFEEGVDLVTDTLKRQLKKYKEKMRTY